MSELPHLFFFRQHYQSLRGHSAMLWMERLFEDVIKNRQPRFVDLPTGAGKTELVAIWLLALAWFGENRQEVSPVPRRLVWIINRRVLVQQVFRLAQGMGEKLRSTELHELDEVRAGLRSLCGGNPDVFQVVELRGQIVADRDWAIRPTVPQLVIGTVDQIGSRLLFQGYGLGKWGRPQQAGLLGVDAWVAVDEAHLVPAFVLTLRQLRESLASPAEKLPAPLNEVFARLPFWLTELSATPGLPKPTKDSGSFSLSDAEKKDEPMIDRELASATRRVRIETFQAGKKASETKATLVEKLVAAAIASKSRRIAIFVREVGVANAVAAGIRAELKKVGIDEDHLCKITGRIRGYERDRLAQQRAFRAFIEPRAETNTERWFLVGTAAAEVGLDADADAIFCDFAPLPTLLQRLGRLDRRGILSRLHRVENGEAPTMVIFTPDPTEAKTGAKLDSLAEALKADTAPYSADLMAGTHWLNASKPDKEKTDDEAKEDKSAKDLTKPLIEAATWSVLSPANVGACTAPKDWLAHGHARIAAGPVVVPPLTQTVLDYWSTTTEARSPHLSPHPFLYGLADDDEGTPLVGVAFRLEVEALRETADGEDDTEAPNPSSDLVEIFERFPPLRSELHQMKLSTVREWLDSAEGTKHPLVYRARDKWHAKPAGESARTAIAALGPNGTLILPASVEMGDACKDLLKDCERMGDKHTPISDVLDGVTDPQRARYLRKIEPSSHRTGGDGAWCWDFENGTDASPSAAQDNGFRQSLPKKLLIGGTDYMFRYYRPHQNSQALQFLDEHDGKPGHIARARSEAARIAAAISPGDNFLVTLLVAAAYHHDEGKRLPKWQRAFGRPEGLPEIAKLAPGLDRPAPLHGYRHEWESLLRLDSKGATPHPELPPDTNALWNDLLLHLVGVHHGHLRPSITDDGLTPTTETEKQNRLRLEAAERFARLQRQLGRWRLAYLEALLKTADADGSHNLPEDEDDDN